MVLLVFLCVYPFSATRRIFVVIDSLAFAFEEYKSWNIWIILYKKHL